MGLAGKRVLVVEDEELIRLILAETLEEHGFQVVKAGTGDEAARLLAGQGGFDLVITDVQMPGTLDGVAVGRLARRHRADIPVLYVTGRPDSLAGAGPLGPREALLRKPYGPSAILATVERLLGEPETAATT